MGLTFPTTVMKAVFLLLAALVASASADVEPWCRCAAFVTYQYSELMVYEAPEVTITSCDDAAACKASCYNELDTMTNGGNLWTMTTDGITVGQHICSYLADRYIFWMSDHKVYGYYEVCGGAWQYTGAATQTDLCCTGGQHDHCVSKK